MRGSIVEKKLSSKSGKQLYIVYDVHPAGLKRKQKWEKVPENTREAARLLLARRQVELADSGYQGDQRRTFGELVEEWWAARSPELKDNSLLAYRHILRNHLLPRFQAWSITDIRPQHIERFKGDLLRTLAPATVTQYLNLLRQIFNTAIRWHWLHRNPVSAIPMPKGHTAERDFLTPDEARQLIRSAKTEWRAFFHFALVGGMRVNELLAARWAYLDWEKAQYTVRDGMSKRRTLSTPKSGHRRTVDLTAACMEDLKSYKTWHAAEALRRGWPDPEWMFPRRTGAVRSPGTFNRHVIHPSLRAAGLRQMGAHALRHTAASLLISAGASPKRIQAQLGHADIGTTLNTYGHLFESDWEAVAEKVDQIIAV